MQTPMQTLEELFYDKIALYQELVDCLETERKTLIEVDIDTLWEISDRKQAIVCRIEAVRGEILKTLSQASVDHGMDLSTFSLAVVLSLIPHEDRGPFRAAYTTLVSLKTRTRHGSQENKLFVEQSLDFLDELMGIFTRPDRQNETYTNGEIPPNRAQNNLFLHTEV